MNDPISSLQAPPPRYLLESDSSDEEGQGEYAASTSRRSTRVNSAPEIKVEWSSSSARQSAKEVFIGVGQVGRYLRRKAGTSKGESAPAVKILAGETKVGRGWVVGGALLLELEDAEGEEAWRVAEKLVNEIKDIRWSVLTSYVPAMYIPDSAAPSKSLPNAPIRCLATSGFKADGIAKWDSPNYLTGLVAAFVSLAAHPASPLQSTSLNTLILPLPLSGISTSTLTSALRNASARLSSTIAEKQKSAPREVRWDEADDEPFSATGMGGGRRSNARGGAGALDKEEISSMYM